MVAVQRLAGTLVAGLRRTVVAQQTTSEQPGQGPGWSSWTVTARSSR
jgi:hypothetical protein